MSGVDGIRREPEVRLGDNDRQESSGPRVSLTA